jgi:hypothetical protein
MTQKPQGQKLLWPYTADIVTVYPLSEDELFVLGVHWAELQLDNSAWCVLSATSGGTERRVSEYTAERLAIIAGVLDGKKVDAIYSEAEERVRQKLGEEFWTAFKEGIPLLRDTID